MRRIRRRRYRGFIILFGTRRIISNDSSPPLRTRCPRCGAEADLLAKSYRQWFTLFFVPVFPMSGKTQFTQCSNCGAQFRLAPQELRQQMQASSAQQNQQAIALYNSLRASPANSVTLNQLMLMYASMNELDQAVSAAAQFPQALNSSEQCMTTLGRVYLAQNHHDDALQWFTAAVQRNEQLGEAQYYKAVAHLLTTPPDYAAAIAAARAARSAAYPNADALLREAEEKSRAQ